MKKKRVLKITLVLSLLFTILFIFSEDILICSSQALVHEDPMAKSEAIVVLGGSSTGNRIKAATELFHKGYAPYLVFSGFEIYPGTNKATLMKTYALSLKVPEENILAIEPDEEISTRGESVSNLELLRKRNIRNFILVTSAYHTRRARLIYKKTIEKLGYDMEFLVHPAEDPLVPMDRWWKVRTGQKLLFMEYLKSVAYYFDL